MRNSVGENRDHQTIALFLPTLTAGGIERCFLNLASGFIGKGYEVDLIVADYRGALTAEIPSQANLVNLKVGRVSHSILPLVRYLRRNEPDVVLSGHMHCNLVVVWSVYLSLVSTKVAVGVHSPHSKSEESASGVRPQFVRIGYPFTYKMADYIIAVSRGVKIDIIETTRIPEDEVSVISNPVDIKTIQEQSEIQVDHSWFSDYQVILGVGRLSPEKDFSTLIDSFKNINRQITDTRLIIVGNGDEMSKLKERTKKLELENKVDFLGHDNNPYKYMAEADIFVLSSKWEGFGYTLVESMAVGTPVISTNCPYGPSEILSAGDYGQLVPVGNAKTLANAIVSQLNNPSNSQKLIERANEFSIGKIVDQYEDLLFGQL